MFRANSLPFVSFSVGLAGQLGGNAAHQQLRQAGAIEFDSDHCSLLGGLLFAFEHVRQPGTRGMVKAWVRAERDRFSCRVGGAHQRHLGGSDFARAFVGAGLDGLAAASLRSVVIFIALAATLFQNSAHHGPFYPGVSQVYLTPPLVFISVLNIKCGRQRWIPPPSIKPDQIREVGTRNAASSSCRV